MRLNRTAFRDRTHIHKCYVWVHFNAPTDFYTCLMIIIFYIIHKYISCGIIAALYTQYVLYKRCNVVTFSNEWFHSQVFDRDGAVTASCTSYHIWYNIYRVIHLQAWPSLFKFWLNVSTQRQYYFKITSTNTKYRYININCYNFQITITSIVSRTSQIVQTITIN